MKMMPEVTYSVIAIIGGAAKYLHAHVMNDVPLNVTKLVSQMIISGFSGAMFANVMQIIKPDWTFVAAGVGGYVGVTAIEFIWEVVTKVAAKK